MTTSGRENNALRELAKLGLRRSFQATTREGVAEADRIIELVGNLHQQYKTLAEKLEEAEKLANEDALTGMPTRRVLIQEGKRREDKAREANVAGGEKNAYHQGTIFVDLNNFGEFDRKYGHNAGDAVLRQVGEVIKRTLRGDDPDGVVVRRSGDEYEGLFAMKMKINDPLAITSIGLRVQKAIAEARLGVPGNHISACVGVTTYRPEKENIADALERADLAAMVAKQKTRAGLGEFREGVYFLAEGESQKVIDELIDYRSRTTAK